MKGTHGRGFNSQKTIDAVGREVEGGLVVNGLAGQAAASCILDHFVAVAKV